MKTPVILLLLILTVVFPREYIAIIDFEGIGVSESDARALSHRLTSDMIAIGEYQILERSEMKRLLDEQKFQYSGCVDTKCAVDIGKMIGAKYMVVGSISKVGSTFSVNARMVSVETSESYISGEYSTKGEIDKLIEEGMTIIAKQLSGLEEINIDNNNNNVAIYFGCMDSTACNYNKDALVDDGTCKYPEQYFHCDGTCLNDTDNDGICDELEISGCTDVNACNFNSDATENDNNCLKYDCLGNCGGSAYKDGCGICDDNFNNDNNTCTGCTDVNACNYNLNAILNDGCEYAQDYGWCDCNGNKKDCFGECGGDAVEDCFGECGGDAVEDECGVCDGPGAIYECGCTDMGVKYGHCDCDRNLVDCSGECGGNHILTTDGICVSKNQYIIDKYFRLILYNILFYIIIKH